MNSFQRLATLAAVGGVGAGAYLGTSALVKDVGFAHAEQQVKVSREELARVQDLANVFKEVGHAVSPSVVSIEVEKKVAGGGGAPMGGMPDLKDIPERLRPFFDRNGDGEPDQNGGPQEFEEVGRGSGVIMDVSGGTGYILTNNHVAADAVKMSVTLNDGRTISDVKVVGTDPKSDLAVVEIKADHLIPAEWGDSDKLERGDIIFAFGSPLGFVGSMTQGIVSALNRQVGIIGGSFAYEDFIQVDAAINPGNSGGPLVNLQGQVVGINTAIASRTKQFSGIGFAIPSDQAKHVYDGLRENGKVTRGWLGVGIADVNDPRVQPLAKAAGFGGDTGVFVSQTFRGTPASGILQPSDVITKIDGEAVDSSRDLRSQIANTQPGKTVKMTVVRNGKEQTVDVKLGEQPENPESVAMNGPARNQAAKTDLGMALADGNKQQLRGLDLKGGAVVREVKTGSLAANAGVEPGDVLTRVDTTDVTDAASAEKALAAADPAKGIALRLSNDQGQRLVYLRSGEQQ